MKQTGLKKIVAVLSVMVLLLGVFSAITVSAETAGPAFTAASLTLEENLTVNFKVKKASLEGYTAFYADFTMNGAKTTVTTYAEDTENYIFSFSNIAPSQMGDEITAVLNATNDAGTSATEFTYSVETYCYNMLDTYADNAKLRTLLVNLLIYGEKSQLYTGHKTDDLVTAALTEEQKAWATAERTLNNVFDKDTVKIDAPAATWKGAGLVLNDSVTMMFRFAAENDYGYTVKIKSESGEWIIPNHKIIPCNNNTYVFYFDGLNAAQMSETLELTIEQLDEAVSNTVTYSVESYAAKQIKNDDSTLDNLLKAMMKYGDAAKAYAA